MNNFFQMALLCSVILGGTGFTISKFLSSIQTDINRKLSKDTHLGDIAETLIKLEKRVARDNRLLDKIHSSCAAILTLPPPAMIKALNTAKRLSKRLKISQQIHRLEEQRLFVEMKTQHYQIVDDLKTDRLTNPCSFDGPIRNLDSSYVEIKDQESGIQITATSEYSWSFSHRSSRSIWF